MLMSDTPEPTGDDPEAYGNEHVVPCPTCESTNTTQIAARGLQYQCRDCSNEFNPSSESMDTDLR
jgi:transposase-like protein